MNAASIRRPGRFQNHVSGRGAQLAATRSTRAASLLHFLPGHMVGCEFLLPVLPLIARLDLFRIFQKTTL